MARDGRSGPTAAANAALHEHGLVDGYQGEAATAIKPRSSVNSETYLLPGRTRPPKRESIRAVSEHDTRSVAPPRRRGQNAWMLWAMAAMSVITLMSLGACIALAVALART